MTIAPCVEEVNEDESEDAKKGARCPCRCDGRCCEVATEDEAEDGAAEIDDHEAERADGFLHISAEGHLKQHVEADMDESGVQEQGCDEAPPLIWVVIVERAHTTQFAKGTLVARVAG